MPSDQPAKPSLGRLEKIDLTHYWATEAVDFAPWLAQPENLGLLGDALGLELDVVLESTQVEALGSDLLCRNRATGGWVLVGNQLTPSDEGRLGRLVTDAADIHAEGVVWVASLFSPEHRAALQWLNRVTQNKVQFFGLEIELWRIGETAMAARFNVVAQPEAPTNPLPADENAEPDPISEPLPVEEAPLEEPLSELQQQNLAFWTELCDQLARRGCAVKSVAPVTTSDIGFAIGRAGFRLYASIHRDKTYLETTVRLFDEDAQAYFHLLLAEQEEIEAEMETPLIWEERTEPPLYAISSILTEVNLDEQTHWPTYLGWLCDRLERLHETFAGRIKALNAHHFSPMPPSSSTDPLPLLSIWDGQA